MNMVTMSPTEIVEHINGRFGDTIAVADNEGDISFNYSKIIESDTFCIYDWFMCDVCIYPYILLRKMGKYQYKAYTSYAKGDKNCLNPENDDIMETVLFYDENTKMREFNLDTVDNVVDALMEFFKIERFAVPAEFEEELAI